MFWTKQINSNEHATTSLINFLVIRPLRTSQFLSPTNLQAASNSPLSEVSPALHPPLIPRQFFFSIFNHLTANQGTSSTSRSNCCWCRSNRNLSSSCASPPPPNGIGEPNCLKYWLRLHNRSIIRLNSSPVINSIEGSGGICCRRLVARRARVCPSINCFGSANILRRALKVNLSCFIHRAPNLDDHSRVTSRSASGLESSQLIIYASAQRQAN